MKFNPDFKEFIELLNLHQVEYMIVGGYAVGFHGYPRYTGDLDFWIAVSNENANKVIQALAEFGFRNPNLTAADFLNENLVFQLGYEPNRIDILTSVSGLDFKVCIEKAINTNIDGLEVRFIDIESLKINKRASGRAKDLGDIENLP
jgi:predicted nucleotidyltransferase